MHYQAIRLVDDSVARIPNFEAVVGVRQCLVLEPSIEAAKACEQLPRRYQQPTGAVVNVTSVVEQRRIDPLLAFSKVGSAAI
jgi:hypothetical protein